MNVALACPILIQLNLKFIIKTLKRSPYITMPKVKCIKTAQGYFQKIHGNIPCCWVCSQCKENQIVLDSETCLSCNKGWWPNANLTGKKRCIAISLLISH